MVLSNAERQRRHRQRLKAAARGDDLGSRVADAIDAALRAVWDIHHRDEQMGGFEDFRDYSAFRASLTAAKVLKHNGHPVEQVRGYIAAYRENATEAEKVILDRAASILAAASLREQG